MGEHYFAPRPKARRRPEQIRFEVRGHAFTFRTDAGVFSQGEIDRGREPAARCTHTPGSRLPPTSDGGYVRSGRHRETRERIQGPTHHEEASLMSKPPTCREVTPADSTKLVPLFEGFYGQWSGEPVTAPAVQRRIQQ